MTTTISSTTESNIGSTRSNEPKMVAARLFVGNMPTSFITAQEAVDRFSKYGKVLGASLCKNYGFVQMAEPEDAAKAINGEHRSMWKSSTIDVRIASEGKKPKEDNSLKRPITNLSVSQDLPGAKVIRQFAPSSSHSVLQNFPQREPVKSVPSKIKPHDAVIVVAQRSLKLYAEFVERKLLELSMSVDMIFLVRENALSKAVEDMSAIGVPYVIIVEPQHEQHHSVTVKILHGVPQEHRNMPLSSAITMLDRNFKIYQQSGFEPRSGANSLGGASVAGQPPSIKFLLNMLAEGKPVTVAEIDRVILDLQERRRKLLESDGAYIPLPIKEHGIKGSLSSTSLDASSVTKTGFIQNSVSGQDSGLATKIWDLLSNGSNTVGNEVSRQGQAQTPSLSALNDSLKSVIDAFSHRNTQSSSKLHSMDSGGFNQMSGGGGGHNEYLTSISSSSYESPHYAFQDQYSKYS